jgi:hypothetical protein
MTSDPRDLTSARAVPRYARIDVLGGTGMVLFAGLVWFGAIGLDTGSVANFGPGAMPRALAVVLFVAGMALLARGVMQPRGEAEAVELALRPTAIVTLAIVLFGLFVRGGQFGPVSTPQLGLAVVGPLTVFVAGCASPQPRFGELLVLAFGLSAATLLVFADLLGVTIPTFPAFVAKAIPAWFGETTALRLLYCAYGLLAGALYLHLFRRRGERHG